MKKGWSNIEAFTVNIVLTLTQQCLRIFSFITRVIDIKNKFDLYDRSEINMIKCYRILGLF